jgi:hypothetical protein
MPGDLANLWEDRNVVDEVDTTAKESATRYGSARLIEW